MPRTRSPTEPLSARTFLEIRLGAARPTRCALRESPVVIGRLGGLGLVLDHHTVSRRHAEMICDQYGRWWIRDLGSTNGTNVDGRPIREHLLSPGDVIGVGDYALTFWVEAADERDDDDVRGTATEGSVPPGRPGDDETPTLVTSLDALEAPRLDAAHLRTLLHLSRRLTITGDPAVRRAALCELCVGDGFHALTAVVIRVENRRAYRALSRVHHAGDDAGPPTIASDRLYADTPLVSRSLSDGPPPESARSPGAGGPKRSLTPGSRKPYVSRSILDALLDLREAVLTGGGDLGAPGLTMGTQAAPNPAQPEGVAALAVPLRDGADSMDVLYTTVPPAFATAEWLKLYELAGEVYRRGEQVWAARLHAQENAAIEHELDTARQIQRGLVPKPYAGAGLVVDVGFEPCRWVGGDYVDVVPLPDGRVLCAIADVCGKGLHAAMVGFSLHTMVRAAADANPLVSDLVERVNKHLCAWLPESSFVTMVAVTVDPATGELEVVNAGHPPAFVVSQNGRLTQLQAAENPALGIEAVPMTSQRARLRDGEVLAMYTDGLTELTDPEGEMLGERRLGEELRAIVAGESARGGGVGAMCAALKERLDAFRQGQPPGDDWAFLFAQRR